MSRISLDTSRSTLSVHSQQDHMPGDYPDAVIPISPNTSTQLSLAQALHARRNDYTRPRTTRVKVGTWNVAAHKSTAQDLGEWFVRGKGVASNHLSQAAAEDDGHGHGLEHLESVADQEARHKKKVPTVPKHDPGLAAAGEDIGIYALGLQEIVDINSAVEALRPFSDLATPTRFKKSMEDALPPGYQLVAEQQLIGLLLLVYAAPDIAANIHSVSTTSVGTGLMGYMGNKGAVTTRLVVGEMTSLVFVNCHLGAGTGKTELERRNWDVSQIISRTRFSSVTDGLGIVQQQGERIGDEEHAFWFGDLNYRLEGVPADDVRKLLMLHVRNEYDISRKSEAKIEDELTGKNDHPKRISSDSSASQVIENDRGVSAVYNTSNRNAPIPDATDPTSLQATLDSLLTHDELYQTQREGNAFSDWREGPITFLPTYKYDVGSVGIFDTGEKKRGPSWCDRILYRSRKDRIGYQDKKQAQEEAKRRDAEMQKQGLDNAAEAERTMFEYDPEEDADEDFKAAATNARSESPSMMDQAGTEDEELMFEYYMSHQRVLSSDHKPLEAVFTLRFDASVPELKSKVQQEVARDLDRAENEGRPVLTVVVDGSHGGDDPHFNGVNFGHVRFDEPKTRSVTLANTGRVTAYFGFVSTPQHSERAQGSYRTPQWLSINVGVPSQSETTAARQKRLDTDDWAADVDRVFKLEPGETTCVDLQSFVKDKGLLRNFNDGEMMEDILVLRVKDGRDHFLPVRGTWQKSLHGRTLDMLHRLPEGGIRALQNQRPDESSNRDRSGSSESDGHKHRWVRWSAPREILRLTEAIESLVERVIAEWDMTQSMAEAYHRPPWLVTAGWPFVEESWTLDAEARQQLRVEVYEALDNGHSVESSFSGEVTPLDRLEATVDAFLQFLDHLEDGVVTAELWSSLEASIYPKGKKSKTSTADTKASVLEVLSSSRSHNVSFMLITSMLGRVTQEVTAAYRETFSSSSSKKQQDLPASPKTQIKRRSLDKDPAIAAKQLMNRNIAAVMADFIFRIPADKTMSGSEAHRREVIEMFIENGVD